MDKKKKNTVIPTLKKLDGSYVFTDCAKALNDYFYSISSIDDNNTDLPYFENRTDSQIDTTTVNQTEILDILSSGK